MKFLLEDSRLRVGTQDLICSPDKHPATIHGMTWAELLDLRNFLDAKLAAREREMRATRRQRTALNDDANVSLHIVEG